MADEKVKEFNFLLNQLPDITESVLKELVPHYRNVLNADKIAAKLDSLSLETLKYLKHNLKTQPLIVNNVIQSLLCLWNHEFVESDELLQSLYHSVILECLEDVENGSTESKDTVLCILSQLQMADKNLQTVIDSIVPKLLSLCNSGKIQYKELYLCLLPQRKQQILNAVLQQQWKDFASEQFVFNKESVFLRCILMQKHWLLDLISYLKKHNDFNNDIISATFLNQVHILLLFTLTNDDFTVTNNNLQDIDTLVEHICNSSLTDQNILRYTTEISRQIKVMQFCHNNGTSRTNYLEMINTNSALSCLSKTCNLSTVEWKLVTELLKRNEEFLKSLRNNSTDSSMSGWDLELFNAFCIIIIVLNLILSTSETINYTASVGDKIKQIKRIFVEITSVQIRVELSENLFALLFLRYENLNMCMSQTDDQKLSGKLNAKHKETGFICSAQIVRDILMMLKEFVMETQAILYNRIKLANETDLSSQTKLVKLSQYISNATWRMQLLTNVDFALNIDSDKEVDTPLSYPTLDKVYPGGDTTEYSSDEMVSPVTRKKHFKRIKSDTDKTSEGSESTNTTEESSGTGRSSRSRRRGRVLTIPAAPPKDFISVMLSSPESLLAQCVLQGDFAKTKQVIQMFNLHSSYLASEIKYTEHYETLKTNLKTLSKQYNEVHTSSKYSNSTNSTLQTIRNIAAAGYGSTRFTNKIEMFLTTHSLPKHKDTCETIETYKATYPFLLSYAYDKNVHITLIDLLLSLGYNYNVSTNLTNLATKYCPELNADCSHCGQMGYFSYVKNVIDIFYESKCAGEDCGVIDIVTDLKFPLNIKQYKMSVDFRKCLQDIILTLGDTSGTSYSKYVAFEKLIHNFKQNPFLENLSVKVLRKSTENVVHKAFYQSEQRVQINYSRRLFVYLNNVLQLLSVDKRDNSDLIGGCDVLNAINLPLKELIGQLVFERGVLASDLEPITNRMRVNLPYYLILNCCKDIACSNKVDSNEELYSLLVDLMDNPKTILPEVESESEVGKYTPDIVLYAFFDKHNWLLSQIVSNIHARNQNEYSDPRIWLLKNVSNLKRIQSLKSAANVNVTIATLENGVKPNLIYNYLKREIAVKNYGNCLEMINALPEIQFKQSDNLQKLKNLILYYLSADDVAHCQFITDIHLQYKCVLKNMKYWNKLSVCSVLQCIIERCEFPTLSIETQNNIRILMQKVQIYDQIVTYTTCQTWHEVQLMSDTSPETILQSLITNRQLRLCLEWNCINPIDDHIKSDLDEVFILKALEAQENLTDLSFTKILSQTQAISICEKLISRIKNISTLQILINYLLSCSSDNRKYINYSVSMRILSELSTGDHESYFEVLDKPLLIIEQFLMNCKFDKLTKILGNIKAFLPENTAVDDATITLNKIDDLLRVYASKSLDFHIGIVAPDESTPREDELLQSLDSASYMSEEEFVMPKDVPDRLEWVENNAVKECMCCRISKFTMFNRRHHCRRCGRVVCCTCSTKRLVIPPMYKDFPVRVCDNCFDLTMDTSVVPDVGISDVTRCSSVSELGDSGEWRLTGDASHNHTVRGEFSYEHAPSVSLCLAIFKLHSDSIECPAFLLAQCEAIVKLLQPTKPGVANPETLFKGIVMERFHWSTVMSQNPTHVNKSPIQACELHLMAHVTLTQLSDYIIQIDHTLLLRMLRSLALAAKVKYSHLIQIQSGDESPPVCDGKEPASPELKIDPYIMPTSASICTHSYNGVSRCEALVAHADLLSLLVEHGCEGLIPAGNLSGHGVRRLRDSLVRAERWSVALELSLKAGLGRGGVLASWGKACLKAGAFQTAREKFRYCLKPVVDSANTSGQIQDTMDYYKDSPFGTPVHKTLKKTSSRSSLNSNQSLVNRPLKNPPLLNEIINIIESTSYKINPTVIKKIDKIKISNTSLAQRSVTKNIKSSLLNEPALNVLHTLANLKNITNGNYNPDFKTEVNKTDIIIKLRRKSTNVKDEKNSLNLNSQNFRAMEPFFFTECMFYLTTYGSHGSILSFYLRHGDLRQALEYVLSNIVDCDIFTDVIYMGCLKKGTVELLFQEMVAINESLEIWKDNLKHICRHLEKSNLLHCLYQIQIFMKDYVRASMTCIRFFKQNATTYSNLLSNLDHLNTAEKHLQFEFEHSSWINITIPTTSANPHDEHESDIKFEASLTMKLDTRDLDRHINTIGRQKELTKFLAACESDGRDIGHVLLQVFPRTAFELSTVHMETSIPPTLFGPQTERLQLAVLAILCGKNVEEGFGLAFRVIQDYQLNPSRVYCLSCKYLATQSLYVQIEQLCRCIQTCGASQSATSAMCDEVAELAIITMASQWHDESASKTENMAAEGLIRIVQDIGTKVSCYIICKQLKSAYLLAVKHNRMGDIRKISREAEKSGQHHIKNICAKRLAQK